jgi:hypothetical protein
VIEGTRYRLVHTASPQRPRATFGQARSSARGWSAVTSGPADAPGASPVLTTVVAGGAGGAS